MLFQTRWAVLKKESGISPDAWYKALAVREVAVAEVPSGSGFGKVILVRPGTQDLSVIFRGSGITLHYRDFILRPSVFHTGDTEFHPRIFSRIYGQCHRT